MAKPQLFIPGSASWSLATEHSLQRCWEGGSDGSWGDLGKGGVVARIQWDLTTFYDILRSFEGFRATTPLNVTQFLSSLVSSFFEGCAGFLESFQLNGHFFVCLQIRGLKPPTQKKNQRIGVRRKVIPQSNSWKEMEKWVTNPKKTNVLNDGQGIGGVYPTSISLYPFMS